MNLDDHCDIVKHDTFVGVQAAIPTAAIPTNAYEKAQLTQTLTLTVTLILTLILTLTLTHCITHLECRNSGCRNSGRLPVRCRYL